MKLQVYNKWAICVCRICGTYIISSRGSSWFDCCTSTKFPVHENASLESVAAPTIILKNKHGGNVDCTTCDINPIHPTGIMGTPETMKPAYNYKIPMSILWANTGAIGCILIIVLTPYQPMTHTYVMVSL